jgi:hypothetical protein
MRIFFWPHVQTDYLMDSFADNIEALGAQVWQEAASPVGKESPGQPSAGGCLVVPNTGNLPVLGDPHGVTDLAAVPENSGWFTADHVDSRPLAVEESRN